VKSLKYLPFVALAACAGTQKLPEVKTTEITPPNIAFCENIRQKPSFRPVIVYPATVERIGTERSQITFVLNGLRAAVVCDYPLYLGKSGPHDPKVWNVTALIKQKDNPLKEDHYSDHRKLHDLDLGNGAILPCSSGGSDGRIDSVRIGIASPAADQFRDPNAAMLSDESYGTGTENGIRASDVDIYNTIINAARTALAKTGK
jgi:hypothetical protein